MVMVVVTNVVVEIVVVDDVVVSGVIVDVVVFLWTLLKPFKNFFKFFATQMHF